MVSLASGVVRVRSQRRILEGAAVASVLSGAPSVVCALAGGSPGAAWSYGVRATRAIGTLMPPGRPSLARGAVVHGAISLAVGEALGAALPRSHSVGWGAVGGLAVGWINLGIVARRRYPELAALALGPQLADNAAFGAVFAIVADR
jgi:hypothetical protein